MSWQINIADDPDTTGENTVTGTWTELDGKTFAFSIRGKATEEAINAGIAAAITARNAWQGKNAIIKATADDILIKLNAADPQAVA